MYKSLPQGWASITLAAVYGENMVGKKKGFTRVKNFLTAGKTDYIKDA